MERRYDFKRDLLNVHKKGLRDFKRVANADEFIISDGLAVVVPKDADKVIMNAVRDFESFLFISMKTSAFVTENDGDYAKKLIISINEDIEEASGYMGYRITVGDSVITLEGYDNRGVAQGLYFLEDLMGVRRAPFLKKQTIKRKSIFTIKSINTRTITQNNIATFLIAPSIPTQLLKRCSLIALNTPNIVSMRTAMRSTFKKECAANNVIISFMFFSLINILMQ